MGKTERRRDGRRSGVRDWTAWLLPSQLTHSQPLSQPPSPLFHTHALKNTHMHMHSHIRHPLPHSLARFLHHSPTSLHFALPHLLTFFPSLRPPSIPSLTPSHCPSVYLSHPPLYSVSISLPPRTPFVFPPTRLLSSPSPLASSSVPLLLPTHANAHMVLH